MARDRRKILECIECRREMRIQARGLCSKCYNVAKRGNTLDKYEMNSSGNTAQVYRIEDTYWLLIMGTGHGEIMHRMQYPSHKSYQYALETVNKKYGTTYEYN